MIPLVGIHYPNNDHAKADDQPKYVAQEGPQVPEDHADVVTAAAEDGEEGISGGSF